MKFTIDQKRIAYKNLPQDVQSFIMDPETTELTENIIIESGISEDDADLVDTEILNMMYGLQTLDEVISNIGQIIQKQPSELSELKAKLKEKVVDKIIEKRREEGQPSNTPLDKSMGERIMEIAQKYSLDSTKKDLLINIISNVSKSESLSDLSNKISINLGFSSVISEQIATDIQNRVLDYTPKSKNDVTKNTAITNVTPKEITVKQPEPTPINIYSAPAPSYTPKTRVVIESEPVQSPVAVPRFKAVPLSDNEMGADFIPKLAPKPSAGGIMESKLNSVTAGITEVKKETPPIVKNYSTDPYREPLN